MRTGTMVALVAAVCVVGSAAMAQGSRPRTDGPKAGSAVTEAGTGAAGQATGWRLVAYYLHGSYRCPTCTSLEEQSRKTVETDFRREIGAGRVAFLALNYEMPENEHFRTDYGLMTKSLVLSLRKDGKEVKWKNLPEIWVHVRTPEKFRAYVAGEVRAMLAEIP